MTKSGVKKPKNKSKRKYKCRKHKNMPQILTKVGGAIVSAAKSAGHSIQTSIEKSEARKNERNRLQSLREAFARRNHVKMDRDIPGKFWLDPYHSIYVDVTNHQSVQDAEAQIRKFIRTSPAKIRTEYGNEYQSALRRSETAMWDW
jgi:hypothetical protein